MRPPPTIANGDGMRQPLAIDLTVCDVDAKPVATELAGSVAVQPRDQTHLAALALGCRIELPV